VGGLFFGKLLGRTPFA